MENSIRYKLTIEERPAYVFAKVKTEPVPTKGSPAYLETIARHCIRVRCNAILIEKHTPDPFAVWDAFSVAPQLAQAGCPYVRIAVVETEAEPPPQKALSVVVGQKCNLDVHVFTSGEEAERWLMANPKINKNGPTLRDQ